MAAMIAIGVGCRKACAAEPIVALVQRALEDCREAAGERRLFSLADKAGEPGLIAAAQALGFALVLLPRERLAAEEPRVLTRSAAAERRFGVACVAEAAALAGAGPDARLLGPRLAAGGATCAIALAGDLRASVTT